MSLGSARAQGQPAPAPLLFITMPTKDRPQLLSRALASVAKAVGPEGDRIELTVSDGSADEASGRAVDQFLASWADQHRFVRNRPPLPGVDNMNRAIELASGDWVMQLDDDDYLLPSACEAMLNAIRGARPEEAVMLFGAISSTPMACAAVRSDSGASSSLSRRRRWSGCCAIPRSSERQQ